jgi:hypothetical protein
MLMSEDNPPSPLDPMVFYGSVNVGYTCTLQLYIPVITSSHPSCSIATGLFFKVTRPGMMVGAS